MGSSISGKLFFTVSVLVCVYFLYCPIAFTQTRSTFTTFDLLSEVDDFCLSGKGSKSKMVADSNTEFIPRPVSFSDSDFVYRPILFGLDSGTLHWTNPQSHQLPLVGSWELTEILSLLGGLVYPICHNVIYAQDRAQSVLENKIQDCRYNWRLDLQRILPDLHDYQKIQEQYVNYEGDSISLPNISQHDSTNYELLTKILDKAYPFKIDQIHKYLLDRDSVSIDSLQNWSTDLSSDLVGSYRPELLVDFLNAPRTDSICITNNEDTMLNLASYDLLIYLVMRSSYLSGLHFLRRVDFSSVTPNEVGVQDFDFASRYAAEVTKIPLRTMAVAYAAIFSSTNYNKTIFDYYYCSDRMKSVVMKPRSRAAIFGIPSYEPFVEQLTTIFDSID